MGAEMRRVRCESEPGARRGPSVGSGCVSLLQGARSMERKLIRLWLAVLCASCAVESDGRPGVPHRSWLSARHLGTCLRFTRCRRPALPATVLRGRGGGGGSGEDDASARPGRQERECAPWRGATEWGSLLLQLERAKRSHVIGHSMRGGGGESSELRRFSSAPLLDPRQTPERGRRGVASRPNQNQPPSLPPPPYTATPVDSTRGDIPSYPRQASGARARGSTSAFSEPHNEALHYQGLGPGGGGVADKRGFVIGGAWAARGGGGG
jgi:hypothetical protein